jgi:hypothetical protein
VGVRFILHIAFNIDCLTVGSSNCLIRMTGGGGARRTGVVSAVDV